MFTKKTPEYKKMLKAAWMMSHTREGISTNSRSYEYLKIQYITMLSESMRGQNNPFYGKKWGQEYPHPQGFQGHIRTEDQKKAISDSMKAHWSQEENRIKRSQSMTISEKVKKANLAKIGTRQTEESNIKRSQTLRNFYENQPHHSKGVPNTQEQKVKIGLALKGRPKSEETKAKMKASWARRKNQKNLLSHIK
jgi:hypothetical protein